MTIKIAQFRGTSLISRGIRFQTRSPYSHTCILMPDKSVYEAWHVGGVAHNDNISSVHSPGTEVDIFTVNGNYNAQLVENFLRQQLGKDYDFWAIGRFLSRRDMPANDKWFCSELALAAFMAGGLNLLNAKPSHTSPRDIGISPLLTFERTVLTQ